MGQMRTLDEFTDQYFRDHPDEIDDYLAACRREPIVGWALPTKDFNQCTIAQNLDFG
jgi:hypothetical protein